MGNMQPEIHIIKTFNPSGPFTLDHTNMRHPVCELSSHCTFLFYALVSSAMNEEKLQLPWKKRFLTFPADS